MLRIETFDKWNSPMWVCIFLLLSVSAAAQKADLMNFVPVSPNAAALGKFGNTPVSYYSGTPTIEIPLYDIAQKSLKVPIKLSYHAGGIRVSEIASWCGLGFALNAGGSIIRNERGLADDHDIMGYLKNGKNLSQSNLTIDDYYNAGKGRLDLESDEYLFNFPGGAGKYVMDQQAVALTIPYQPIKIYPLDFNGNVFTPNSLSGIESWKIITTDGTQYFFGEIERSEQPQRPSNNSHITAWHLTKIVSSDKSETITFEYEDATITTNIPIGESSKIFVSATDGDTYSSSISTAPYYEPQMMEARRIRKVKFDNGYVEFFPSANLRCDLYDELLDKMVVYDNNNIVKKEVTFKYGYLKGTTLLPAETVSCGVPDDNMRLTLLSVQETGKSPYKFEYIHDKGLPSRFSKAQDHWGFYNRADNGQVQLSLIPEQAEVQNGTVRILGMNRQANVEFGKQYTLNKVTYPTGGTTEYIYEAHQTVLSGLDNFPEFAEAYNIVPNPARTFQVDYNANNFEVASFEVNYLDAGTTVYLETDGFIETSGSYFKIINAQNQEMYCYFSHREGSKRFYSCKLVNGTYRIIAMRLPQAGGSAGTYSLTLKQYDTVTLNPNDTPLSIGGLRIKQIKDTDPVTGVVQRKEFEYGMGTLTWGLKYSHLKKEYVQTQFSPVYPNRLEYYVIGEFCELSSNSNYPLSNTQGSPVGYGSVIVREKYTRPDLTEEDNGYTELIYTTSEQFPDEGFVSYSAVGQTGLGTTLVPTPELLSSGSLVGYEFPFTPPKSNDWKRGLLKHKFSWKKNSDGSYRVVASESNFYSVAQLPRSANSVRAGVIFDAIIARDPNNEMHAENPPPDEVAFSFYNATSEYGYLRWSEAHSYDDTGRDVAVTTEYFYDNTDHLLPTRVTKTSNDGKKINSVTTYPQDYAAGTPFIDALVAENNISAPIENVVYLENADGSKKVIEGLLVTYLTDGKGLKESVKVLENIGTLNFTDFKFSNRVTGVIPTPATSKTAFAPAAQYETKVIFNKYANGNLLEQQKLNDVVHSFIWDYNHQRPIAIALNASEANIAFTSFETGGLGNWTLNGGATVNSDAYTGVKSYSIAGGNTITKSNLSAGSYIVSYWSKDGSLTVNGSTAAETASKAGWKLYEHRLTNITSVSITGTATLDDLKLYPEGARITTYTFDPLIGVTSQTDTNNKTTFYEYDSIGRLIAERDENRDIRKKYKYNYAR
ncbi:MAG: hypothetical protein ACOYXT_19060 [Bacteroidota bacterium]